MAAFDLAPEPRGLCRSRAAAARALSRGQGRGWGCSSDEVQRHAGEGAAGRLAGLALVPLGVPAPQPSCDTRAWRGQRRKNAADQSGSSSDNYSKIEALLQEERVPLLWFSFFALLSFFLSLSPSTPHPPLFFLSFMSKLLFQGYRTSRLEAEILPLCPGVGFPGLDM